MNKDLKITLSDNFALKLLVELGYIEEVKLDQQFEKIVFEKEKN